MFAHKNRRKMIDLNYYPRKDLKLFYNKTFFDHTKTLAYTAGIQYEKKGQVWKLVRLKYAVNHSEREKGTKLLLLSYWNLFNHLQENNSII